MSVLATMQFLPDAMASAPRQQASDMDPLRVEQPTWLQSIASSFRATRDDQPTHIDEERQNAYADLANQLQERGKPHSRYWQDGVRAGSVINIGAIWADVLAERQKDPSAFGGVPRTQEEFEAKWQADMRRRQDRDALIVSQSHWVPWVIGSLGGGLTDPINLAMMAATGGGGGLVRTMGREALANAGTEFVETPLINVERQRQGRPIMSAGEATANIALAGLTGAAFPAALHIGGGAVKFAGATLSPYVSNAAETIRKMVPRHDMLPNLAAAANVIERDADIRASNPFEQTYDGIDTHLEKVRDTMAKLEAGAKIAADDEAKPKAVSTPAAPLAPGEWAGIIDAYMASVGRQESGGNDAAVNPLPGMTASGRYGFTNGTWTSWYRKVFPGSGLSEEAIIARKADGATQDRVMRAMTEDNARWLQGRGEQVTPGNLYVVHHMGQGDARVVFDAAPGTPLKGLLPDKVISNNPHLANMTAGQFIAWADKRMGGDGSTPGLTPIDIPTPAEVRPEVLGTVRPQVTFEGRDIPLMQFSPADIGVDAELMQFKSGGDQYGVTERLQGVQRWDPIAAGVVTVWEANDGRRLIADGHQRLGLAKRILAADPSQPIMLNAFVLREADGFTAVDARVLTALKNIGEGTGTALDAAKVFRDVGLDKGVLSRLPPRSALVRDGKALARLSPEAFGAAINDVIPESYAAAIGHLADDPATHAGLVALLNKIDPPNRAQAESIIRQALDAGFRTEEQFDMFGGSTKVTALFAHKAKALDKALAELRKLKGAFSVAARNAEALDAAGNKINVDASTAAAEGNARALDLVNRLALRKGNAVSAIFNDAAERLANGEPLASVVRDAVRQLGELDLANVLEEAGSAHGAGDPAGGSGRGGFADDAPGPALDPQALTPATRDELEAAGQGGFALFDEEPGKAFDDPAGEGVQAVADSAWHDAKAAVEAPQPVHPVTGETMDQVRARSIELRDQFPAADEGGHAGTHNIANSAPVPTGGTRGELRVAIAKDMLAKPALQERIAHLVLGPPAAGKSSFADPLAERWGARIIDSDEAKAMLPEFADGVGAMAVHEESDQIAKAVVDASIANGDNILLPLVGKTYSGLENRINALVKQNYRVYVHLVDLPIDKATSRAIARFGETGRFVDPEYVKSVGTQPFENYQRLIAEFGDQLEGHTHVSNDVARGEAPRIVEAGGRDATGGSGSDRGAGLAEGRGNQPGVPGSDLGAKAGEDVSRVDPNLAAKARQEADIAAQQPLTGARKTGVAQDPAMPEGLFGGPQEPTFDLGDGKGERTLGDIEAEIAADEAAIDAIKGCLL